MTTYKASTVRPTALRDSVDDRVRSAIVTFRESDGSAAGVYTGSVVIPGGSYLVDVIVHSEVLWTADTSAEMDVGDGADPNGFLASVDLKATDLAAAESANFVATGALEGADVDEPASTGAHVRRRYLPNPRTITGVVTTVGAVGTAGITHMVVLYVSPGSVTEASFEAT